MSSEATSNALVTFNRKNLKKETSKADAHSEGGHIVIQSMIRISSIMIIFSIIMLIIP